MSERDDCPCCYTGPLDDAALLVAYLAGIAVGRAGDMKQARGILCTKHRALADDAVGFAARHGVRLP